VIRERATGPHAGPTAVTGGETSKDEKGPALTLVCAIYAMSQSRR
jgi:hypothetical protein